MNIVAIIQARTGSTRFENKVMKKLYTKTLIEHIVERIDSVELIKKIVVATTINEEDDKLEALLISKNISVFRGSENNVLERFYLAGKEYHADIIVRVTSDDPFKDPQVITQALTLLIDSKFDYVSNTIIPTYPEGIDIEVFTFDALKKAFINAKLKSEQEHVTPYIWKNNCKNFSIHNFSHTKDISSLRWTIDYESDFEFANKIYNELYEENKLFSMDDILKVSNMKNIINKTIVQRNEGYQKSIMKEGKK